MPSEKNITEEAPLFLRIIHWIFARCAFGEHPWKEPTKESSLAECTACGYMPVCPKHKERLFVHGYEYKLGCKSCRDESYAEYLKRSGQERGSIATYTSKFKEGLVFYIDNATEEEILASGWKRSEYCKVHEKENAVCGCIRFERTEIIDGKEVFFNVRLGADKGRDGWPIIRPRTLGFEVCLATVKGEPVASYGDYREIKGHMHFDKVYARFIEQAKGLIEKYG